MWTIIFILIVIFVISGLFNKSQSIGNWNKLFPEMQHDPEEFYSLVEQVLKDREVPDFRTSRRTFREAGLTSHHRLYLEVSRGDFIFHVCAAPWGTGFFFSTWARKREDIIGAAFMRIPVIGKILEQLSQDDPYYKLDTDAMFKKSVQQCVLEAIDKITEAKGIRGLTESERGTDLRTINH